MSVWLVFCFSLGYLGLLFGIAYYGDRRAESGRSLVANPYVYALSMAVYCTAWTFYGSVGRAAATGIGFLPIYLGPTLTAALGWPLLRKMIRISKVSRITSLADFIASRYGKSMALGALASCIAVLGIIPYISLQLRAISTSFTLLSHPTELAGEIGIGEPFSFNDTAFYVAILLAVFAVLFGTRHLDVTEHHEGLVAAIAFESVVKLLAFLAVGFFVTYGMFDGFGDIFRSAATIPDLRRLFTYGETNPGLAGWGGLMLLSMLAILFLPRQFQMSVVENRDERYLAKASWLFPLYLLVINVFVLPIAFGGLLTFPRGSVDADTFVLTLPLAAGQDKLALFVFVGGLSAATSMVIVAAVALSTMVSNDLVVPILLRLRWLDLSRSDDLGALILRIRRVAIVVILALGYLYLRLTGIAVPLVSIGLISFAAVAQLAPAILGGMYWKGGTRSGALAGLLGGFAVWGYTLPLPLLVASGWIPTALTESGPFGLAWLRPHHLFGLNGFDPISHSLFWSLLVNVGAYVGVSLVTRQTIGEQVQARLFVDIFQHSSHTDVAPLWRGTASVENLRTLLQRFLGADRANAALNAHARRRGLDLARTPEADAELVGHAERLLAGTIGAASARVALASVVSERRPSPEAMMQVLDETTQLVAYSRELELRTRQLETQSLELERASAELRKANARLQELDRLKDDFLSTMTHELRTPLTSIRAFSEILHDNPELDRQQRLEFLRIILQENERLTRLINQVLDLTKLESGLLEWHPARIDVNTVVEQATVAMSAVIRARGARQHVRLAPMAVPVVVDPDRLMQVMLNLLSNAAKFCAQEEGQVRVEVSAHPEEVEIAVADNGPGIPKEEHETIFEKFRQVSRARGDRAAGDQPGTGLGLAISREIVTHFGGRLWVEDGPSGGAVFRFRLPAAPPEASGSETGPRAASAEENHAWQPRS